MDRIACPFLNWISHEEKRKREHRRFSGQEVAWNLNVLVDKTKAKTTRRRKNGTEKPEIRTHALRKLFIHSEEEELASQTSRYGRMERVEKQLVHLQETVKNYPTTEQLQRKIAKLLQDKKLTSFYNYAVCGEPRNRPTGLEFSRNEHALQQARRLDGRYVLLTSQSCEKLSLNEALCTYKQQGRLEARFSDWKGPLMVRPVYLKGNQRIVGLVLVMALALLIYTLIERDARKAVASEGGRMWGLYPGGRLSRPTARQMLRVLSTLTLVLINIGGKIAWLPVSPNEVQAKILDMLNVDYPGG